MRLSDTKLVQVFEAGDVAELHQARLALEAAEIPFVLEGEFVQGGEWLTGSSGAVFRVSAARVKEARMVISEFLRAS